MYLLGGFDGAWLNDMHTIALPMNLFEEDSIRINSRPMSSSSQYYKSDEEDKETCQEEILDSNRKMKLLEAQVAEL